MRTFFEFAREQINPDFALWGGDSVPDSISTLSLEGNVAQVKKVTREVMNSFPDTKIFATIGNHDTYPQDIFKMKQPHQTQAVREWSQEWFRFDFLQSDEARQTFTDYGYYSAPLTY